MTPQVGEIWLLRVPIPTKYPLKRDTYFLLLSNVIDDINAFRMLCLDNGQIITLFMNFQLDDWEKHE